MTSRAGSAESLHLLVADSAKSSWADLPDEMQPQNSTPSPQLHLACAGALTITARSSPAAASIILPPVDHERHRELPMGSICASRSGIS